jgi:hypothetical protein
MTSFFHSFPFPLRHRRLDRAYESFRESVGTPSIRVAVLSLRDDILAIPRIEGGRALSQTERITRFRQSLTSGALLDGNGYLTVPFSTTVAQLSPLTRNHKVLYPTRCATGLTQHAESRGLPRVFR